MHIDSGLSDEGLKVRFNAQSSWTKWVQNIINMRNAEEQATSTFSAIIDNNFREKYIRLILDNGLPLQEAIHLDTACKYKNDLVKFAEKAWNEAQAFLKKRGYNNIKGILYDDMSHEILNEKQNKIVYADMLKWIME